MWVRVEVGDALIFALNCEGVVESLREPDADGMAEELLEEVWVDVELVKAVDEVCVEE